MTAALKITDLKKVYANGPEALKGISMTVDSGDFFALLGPNGAGKSTTLGIVSSLVNKSAGRVEIYGHDLDTDLVSAKMCLGVVPQEFNFNMFEKVWDIVITQAGYYGIPPHVAKVNAEKYLKKLGLWEKRDTVSRTLSGGMKRRLMIARALIHEPKLLILDEPTAGVDIELRRSMWDFLKEINAQGTTIILTTHYLEEAEALCRNIAIIDKGTILAHTSKRELLQNLQTESFVIELSEAITELPDLDPFSCHLDDQGNLVVEVAKGRSLNAVFERLNAAGIKASSMRPTSNRLEELFINMVEGTLS
ncbi:ABC transporter ATP-binding protein [Aestuariispira insulae]|uniref:ABC-2 type transport system ATP-binding protein n=1 Tax=Aestuariispira insulae TaxID=1461337 RepID=A0A3D9HXN4_9PROT|nr:ABC transporter ATP-binding protein [Aestuariispira insulae]RED54131.1 ABC-2 type transport system ATP-binding protein [Aestuariispira insulae]